MQIVQGFLPSKDVITRASAPLDGENKNEGVPRRRNWTAVEFAPFFFKELVEVIAKGRLLT